MYNVRLLLMLLTTCNDPSLKGHPLYKGCCSSKDTNSWQQVLDMHVILSPKETSLIRTEVWRIEGAFSIHVFEVDCCNLLIGSIARRADSWLNWAKQHVYGH